MEAGTNDPPTDSSSSSSSAALDQGLEQLDVVAREGAARTEDLAQTTELMAKEQQRIDHFEIGLLIVIVVTIVLKCITVFMTYEKMIKIINSATYHVWPTGGFFTALCVSYPILSGFFGFETSSLPAAAYISFQLDSTFSSSPLVSSNPGSILDQMYTYSETNKEAGAEKIICDSWGGATEANIGACTAACKGESPYPGMISSAFSTGMMGSFAHGSFMGHTTGGAKAGGMGVFFLGAAAIGAGISYWSNKSSNDSANAANPACSGKQTTVS